MITDVVTIPLLRTIRANRPLMQLSMDKSPQCLTRLTLLLITLSSTWLPLGVLYATSLIRLLLTLLARVVLRLGSS